MFNVGGSSEAIAAAQAASDARSQALEEERLQNAGAVRGGAHKRAARSMPFVVIFDTSLPFSFLYIRKVCDAVMCVEMLFFAIGHAYAFPASQFERVRPHHTTLLAARSLPTTTVADPSDGRLHKRQEQQQQQQQQQGGRGGGTGPGFEGAAASKQWLVEWGDYWERERESPGATGKLA